MEKEKRKSIKVPESLWQRLDNIRGKHETFPQVIDRVMSSVELLKDLAVKFQQDPAYQEWRKQQHRNHREGNDNETTKV